MKVIRFKIIVVIFIVVACTGFTLGCNNASWQMFKHQFKKHYSSMLQEINRRAIFCRNFQMIFNHNERYKHGEETFEMGINQFADWTSEEFRNWLKGGPMPEYNLR